MKKLKDLFSSLKKIKEFKVDWKYYFSLISGFLPGPIIIAVVIIFSGHIPGWIISPAIILGWCLFNFNCLSYEAWRASGPRGVFINTYGTMDNMLYILIWLFFGVFIMAFNMLLRHEFIYLNTHNRITLKKQ